MIAVKINENNIFTWLIRGSLALMLVLALAGYLLVSLKFAASLVIGSLLAIANFYWLRNILQRTLQLHSTVAPRYAILRYILRLALLALILFILLTTVGIDIIGIIIGLSVLVINIIAVSIYMSTLKGG